MKKLIFVLLALGLIAGTAAIVTVPTRPAAAACNNSDVFC
jgi:hypothetical protein